MNLLFIATFFYLYIDTYRITQSYMNETNLNGGVVTAVLLQYNLTQLKAQCDLIHTVL